MSLNPASTWICWGKPDVPVQMKKWICSHRSAIQKYGYSNHFYGKRYAIRLDEWQTMVTRSLELIQAEMEPLF